jgi:hypothetical protein
MKMRIRKSRNLRWIPMATGVATGWLTLNGAGVAQEPVSAASSAPPGAEVSTPDVESKLKSIVLSLDFTTATLEQATRYLSAESHRLDPGHLGVNFVIHADALNSGKSITLNLNNVTLGDALRNVCDAAGVQFKVADGAVHLAENADELSDARLAVQPVSVTDPSVQQKCQAILIDKVDCDKMDIVQMAQFLTLVSREFDPDHRGIKFTVEDLASKDHVYRQITLRVLKVPLGILIHYIIEQTNLRYSIDADGVSFME